MKLRYLVYPLLIAAPAMAQQCTPPQVVIPPCVGSFDPYDTESRNRCYQANAEALNARAFAEQEYRECLALEAIERQQLEQLIRLQQQELELQRQLEQQRQQPPEDER